MLNNMSLQFVVDVPLLIEATGILGALGVWVALEACALLDAGAVDADVLGADVPIAEELGADDEKYDPVEVLDVVEAGLGGRGVDGGDERTTWDLEPGTLIDKGFEPPYPPAEVGWLFGEVSAPGAAP